MFGRSVIICAVAGVALAGCSSPYARVGEVRNAAALATTAEQKKVARAAREVSPAKRLGFYLDEADAARQRLLDDPKCTIAGADYNFAVARAAELAWAQYAASGDRAPLECPSPSGRVWKLAVVPPVLGAVPAAAGARVVPVDRLKVRGRLVGEQVQTVGLGAPVVYAHHQQRSRREASIRDPQSIFYGLTAALQFSGDRCELTFLDPLDEEVVSLDGRAFPLAADYRAGFAVALEALRPKRTEVAAFFRPETFLDTASLARMQPYDPEKIPVLLIHGLGNSPATWLPVVSAMRSDPEMRRHYQFLYFWYPTGLPYPLSAALLRRQLDAFRRAYPDHKDLVVIGHSMGGMIARLLVTDSGSTLWDTYFDRPPSEIPLPEDSAAILKESLIFKARPDIARVIFVSASHRGSDLAIQTLGRIGSRLIGNPMAHLKLDDDFYSLFRPDSRSRNRSRLPNGVELLDPNNTFVQTADGLPIKAGIPFHSLIGDRGRGGFLDRTFPSRNDGVVPYWSSHLRGATSEHIIPSGHWSHLHPLGMAEIKRILRLHLRNRQQ